MSVFLETIDINTRKTILEEMEKSDDYLTSNDLPYKCKIIRYLKSNINEIDKDKSIAQFIVNYQNGSTSYVGFINYLFERELFGINYFSDGSIYLGEFNRNIINGLVYLYIIIKKICILEILKNLKKKVKDYIYGNQQMI